MNYRILTAAFPLVCLCLLATAMGQDLDPGGPGGRPNVVTPGKQITQLGATAKRNITQTADTTVKLIKHERDTTIRLMKRSLPAINPARVADEGLRLIGKHAGIGRKKVQRIRGDIPNKIELLVILFPVFATEGDAVVSEVETNADAALGSIDNQKDQARQAILEQLDALDGDPLPSTPPDVYNP